MNVGKVFLLTGKVAIFSREKIKGERKYLHNAKVLK